jgi:hypothetical protein
MPGSWSVEGSDEAAWPENDDVALVEISEIGYRVQDWRRGIVDRKLLRGDRG